MIWVLVVGLAGWVLMLAIQQGTLKGQIEILTRRYSDLRDQLDRLQAAPPAAPAPRRSRKAEAAAPSIVEAPASRPLAPLPEMASVAARVEAPAPRIVAPPPKPAGPPMRQVVRAWLEENGLAWAGGAALALGGLFLVTYAAQKGMFTPPLRIAAAVATGFVLLGASEWLRRRSDHPLAAAAAAGAGASTLYGAAWASYWLYSFIGLGAAGGLLGVISLGLLALAFRYGEPLAVLAILGAALAPAVTGPEHWSAPALTGYLALITLTGYAVSGARTWGLAGMATLAAAALWAVAGFAADGYDRVAALALAPLVLACGAREWRARRALTEAAPDRLFTLMPTAALAVAMLLLAALWAPASGSADVAPTVLPIAAIGAGLLALITAVAARRSLVPAVLLALGWFPALLFLFTYEGAVDPAAREAWGAVLVAVLATAGVIAALGRRDLATRYGASAAALVALVLAMSLHGPVTTAAPWAPSAAIAVILLAAVTLMARQTDDPKTDLPLALWIWGAGAAALYALRQGVDPRALPVAAGSLSLGAALLHARLGWRGFAGVMIAAASASLAALIAPALFDSLAHGRLAWWGLLLVAGASVGLAYAGAWISRRADRPASSAEAQSTVALLIAIAGVGVLLRFAATGGFADGGALDVFLETSLRTISILVAGLASAQAVRADSSLIGRWRGQVLLAAGLAHAILLQVTTYNPLIAGWKPAVAGPPILDSLAVGFLAPALILGLATWKKVAINRGLAIAYAAATAFFALAWALMETRRLFQGASLHAGFDSIGRAEAAAYALILLLAVRAVIWVLDWLGARNAAVKPLADSIVRNGQWVVAAVLAFSLLVFGYGASPWWGPIDRPLAGVRATALLLALYVAGGGAAFLLAGPAVRAGAPLVARAARLSVVVIAFALLNLIVRLAFRGFDMRPTLQEASLETWTFSAVWGLFGFGLLVYGAARRSNDLRAAGMAGLIITLAKIFLFDMAHLEGVIRAASFLAVGALLLAAAVLVRRLGGTGGLPFGLGKSPSPQTPEP